MKLCILSMHESNPFGGSELLWNAMAQRAIECGHELAIVKTRFKVQHPAMKSLAAKGAKIFWRWPQRTKGAKLVDRYIFPLPRVSAWRPDCILINQGGTFEAPLSWPVRKFLEKTDRPYALLCHHNADDRVLAESERQIAIACFRKAKAVFFVSEHNRICATRQLAINLPRSQVVQNPINMQSELEVPWPDGQPIRLACVSRLDARIKGQETLLEALSSEEWKARDWQLRLYGDGPHRKYLGDLCLHLGLSSRVSFCGHVSDIRSVWSDNHILVLPTRSEGTPMSLIEAMTCGRPSIVTDVGGNTEWICEPSNGFVAAAPTLRSLRATLERAWEARVEWPAMGRRAREMAISKRDPDPAGTLLSCLNDMVKANQ